MASIVKTAWGFRAHVYVAGVRESRSFKMRREASTWAAARETELRDPDFPVGEVGEITPEMLGRWRDARWKVVAHGSVIRDLGLLSAILEHTRR